MFFAEALLEPLGGQLQQVADRVDAEGVQVVAHLRVDVETGERHAPLRGVLFGGVAQHPDHRLAQGPR